MINSFGDANSSKMSWLKRADAALLRKYKITFQMGGFTESQIGDFYSPRQTSTEFVEWFAVKYDLYEFT